MWRQLLPYGIAFALAAVVLRWLEYRYLARVVSVEAYVTLIALGFIALGLWLGKRLTPAPRPVAFVVNDAAVRSLGLTPRERELLALIATGQSNKQLARTLGISPNTVKTHLARIFEKLGVGGRIEAIEKARWLAIIPPGEAGVVPAGPVDMHEDGRVVGVKGG